MYKSICISIIAILLSIGALNGEEDKKDRYTFFVGLNSGYMPFKYTFDGAYGLGHVKGAGEKIGGSAKGVGRSYGLRIGYIFYQYKRVTTRFYLDVDQVMLSGKYSHYQGVNNFVKTTQDIDMLNTSINMDSIFDTFQFKNLSFGPYIGFGMEFISYNIKNNYVGKGHENASESAIKNRNEKSVILLFHLGLRALIAKRHSINASTSISFNGPNEKYEHDGYTCRWFWCDRKSWDGILTTDSYKINKTNLNFKLNYSFLF